MKPTLLTLLMLFATIFSCAIFLNAQTPEEYPLATYTALPQSFEQLERDSLLSINCKMKPNWCVPEVNYAFTAPISCPGGLEAPCPWKYTYKWYNEDYHLLAVTQSDPEQPTAIPNPWSQIDDTQEIPDIIFASVRAKADCPCKEVPAGTASFQDVGTFKIGKENVVVDVPIIVHPNPYLNAGIPIPKFNATFGYRLPPIGLIDNRKRIGWNVVIPPHTPAQLKKMTEIEFVPHGLVQFASNDHMIERVMNQIRCFWGDSIQSRLSRPQFQHRDDDGASYWSFRIPIPQTDDFIEQQLPFVIDCSAILDGDDPSIHADWIIMNPVSQTNTLSLRFLGPTGTPVTVLQFRPQVGESPLHVIDWVVFDEVVQHNNVVPISPIVQIETTPKPVMGRFQLTTPPDDDGTNKKNKKGNEIKPKYLTTYAFDVEFEKFGKNHLDFFRDTSPLSDNALTLDLSGVELANLIKDKDSLDITSSSAITATYTISCKDNEYLPVGSGNMTWIQQKEYVNPTYPTIRFTPDHSWEADSNVTDTLCYNSTQFLTSFFIIIENEENIKDTKQLYHSSIIISTAPVYTIGPDTLIATSSYQFTAAARTDISQSFTFPKEAIGPFILNPLSKTIVKKDKKKKDIDNLFQNNDFINFNTINLDIPSPYVEPGLIPLFNLDLIGIGYRFCGEKNNVSTNTDTFHTSQDSSPHYNLDFSFTETPSLTSSQSIKCQFNEADGLATILGPSTLSMSFPTAQWPKRVQDDKAEGKPVKITCPHLTICSVPLGNSTDPFPSSTGGSGKNVLDQRIMIAFTLGAGRPSIVQYLNLKHNASYWLYIIGLITLLIVIAMIVFIVIRMRSTRPKKASQGVNGEALLNDAGDDLSGDGQYQQLN